MNVGLRVGKYLKDNGISQTFLAKKILFTRASVNRFVTGKNDISATTLIKIAEALNVDPGIFLKEKGEEKHERN